tara:strand:- start:476 stop:613 length:138 start_codon:yes stop_codon:yes gene_type:complete
MNIRDSILTLEIFILRIKTAAMVRHYIFKNTFKKTLREKLQYLSF